MSNLASINARLTSLEANKKCLDDSHASLARVQSIVSYASGRFGDSCARGDGRYCDRIDDAERDRMKALKKSE